MAPGRRQSGLLRAACAAAQLCAFRGVLFSRRTTQKDTTMPKSKKPAGGRPAKNFEPRYGAKTSYQDRKRRPEGEAAARGPQKPGSKSPGHRGYRADAPEAPAKKRWNASDRAGRDESRGIRTHSASDRPARSYDDRPARSYDDRPARSYDRPVRQSGDARPARDFGTRPPRSYDDRPARSYDNRPPRSNDDRPGRSYDSRP